MSFNSTFDHAQPPRDQFVGEALTDEGRNLLFALGQRRRQITDYPLLGSNDRMFGHGGSG